MQRIAEQFQKQLNTERFLKEDSPKDNIKSEKAAMKIHEATASCMKFSKELTKYDVTVAIHTQAGFLFVHAEES